VAELSDYAKAFEDLAGLMARPERHAGVDELHRVYKLRHEAVAMLVDALSLSLQMANDSMDAAAKDLAEGFDRLSRSSRPH